MIQSAASPTEQSWLSWFFRGLLVLGILILLGRLLELQIIKGEYYKELAEGNRVRRVAIVAPRGRILDKNGEVLVDNKLIEKTAKFDPLEGYTKELADESTPKDEIIPEWERKYIYGADIAHVTGYLGEAGADEVGKIDPQCPEKGPHVLGSYVGKIGLEQYYDCYLRGIDGEELVEVDTMGRRIRSLGRKQAIPGEDLKTHIDYKIQRKVAEAMKGFPGAAIVTNPSGVVAAIFSSPSFDPNIFVGQTNSKTIASILSDTSLPLFNRFIGGVYHPASVFKIVTTIAAVEEGKIDSDFRYDDKGVIKVDEFEYKNWYLTQYGGTEGVIDVVRALARSTDTFYYEVGALIGAEKLSLWSEKFGLSKNTEIDLTGEIAGLVPSPEWKKAVKGERWFLGNTYHMAIGQGDLSITPAANHRLAMAIANGGKVCSLRISGDTKCEDLGLKEESVGLVSAGMKAACAPGGTGVPFFEFQPTVACKTGTAETSVEDETHAWFTVFSPVDNPEYVVTVLVEKGGEGSKVAAPIAREILDYIYHP